MSRSVCWLVHTFVLLYFQFSYSCSSYLLLFARAEKSHFLGKRTKEKATKAHTHIHIQFNMIVERRDEIGTKNGKIYPSLHCVLAVCS